MVSKIPLANIKGAKGDPGAPSTIPGPQGLPGVNAVPADAAVATYMGTPGTQTEAQLNANMEAAVLEPGPVRAGVDARVLAVAPRSPAPTIAGLTRALDGGQSAALLCIGDSTGDSDGTVAADDRTFARFARRLAQKYAATHHVLFKGWQTSGDEYKAWAVLNAHPSGRRGAVIAARSLRYKPATAAEIQHTTGNVDVRALVKFATLSATGTIAAASFKEVDGVKSVDNRWHFRLNASGLLYLQHSETGATYLTDRISTVALSTVAQVDVPIWVRATLEITPGTGFVVKFYTSPADDGVNWTKLGDDRPGGSVGTVAMHQAVDGAYVEFGASGWQPTSSPLTGATIYEVQVRDGVNGPTLTPCNIESLERFGDPSTTYVGAPTLYVLNASRSGQDMAYHTDPVRLKKETQDYGQQAIIINNSHNESSKSGPAWIAGLEAWGAALTARLRDAVIHLIGQNPHQSGWPNEAAFGPAHIKRTYEASTLAAKKGWGFINVRQAFLDDPRGWTNLVQPNDIHPTPVGTNPANEGGYAVAGDALAKYAAVI